MEYEDLSFNVIVPEPFSLENQDRKELEKLVDEITSKVELWEMAFSNFFGEWNEIANNARMIVRDENKRPRGMFSSKNAETPRAFRTLSDLWFSMMTSGDPYFECVRNGVTMGREITEEELYVVEGVLRKQLDDLRYEKKLLNSLKGVSLFGTAIVEEPYVTMPYGGGGRYIEGTDFVYRSLLQTGFDPYVFDIDCSDYIFTVDYPTKYKLRDTAMQNGGTWNMQLIDKAIKESSEYTNSGGMVGNFKSNVWNRIYERKQRAGYNDIKDNVHELITYHGRLDTSNKVLQNYWESERRQDDIKASDFTVGILNTKEVIRLHDTFGGWRHHFKTASYNQFELEPIGYGVGRLGKRYQRELDVVQSRANDALAMAIYTMFKVGKYAGVKASQLNIKPFALVEMENIDQLEQLKVDMNTIVQALAMMGISKEDFRALTGATANLQAVATKATATEASLTQSEAIRGSSVVAKIIASTFVKEHIETSYINNTQFLENPVYAEIKRGEESFTVGINKDNLPKNIGILVKLVLDKDFRPERNQSILNMLQILTSIRSDIPAETAINAINSAFPELYRGLGLDPRKLRTPVSMADQLTYSLQRAAKTQGGNNNPLIDQLQAEVAGAASGDTNMAQGPTGEVPTSPIQEVA